MQWNAIRLAEDADALRSIARLPVQRLRQRRRAQQLQPDSLICSTGWLYRSRTQ